MYRIFIVEDDEIIAGTVKSYLENGITRCFVWRILTMCFTFTVQIMHHIPILMSYFGDYYARLLVS